MLPSARRTLASAGVAAGLTLAFGSWGAAIAAILVQANADAVSRTLMRLLFQAVPPGAEGLLFNSLEAPAFRKFPALPLLLERLRVWWRVARAQGKMLDGGWLFPGLNPIESLSPRQLNRAVQAAALAAGIDKRVSMHTLRHCFATHLLEQKVDIRIIQALLGHKKLDTTVIYTQVATDLLREVVSPLETLQSA